MTVLTLALLAGSQPAAPRLAPVHQIGPQSRRQSPHTPCAPLVRTDALTVTWQKADRYKRSAPTSSSHTPWPNPHSACGTAAAPLPAISCLGAFRPPAARARGEVRHCRQPKTCTGGDMAPFRSSGELDVACSRRAASGTCRTPDHRNGQRWLLSAGIAALHNAQLLSLRPRGTRSTRGREPMKHPHRRQFLHLAAELPCCRQYNR